MITYWLVDFRMLFFWLSLSTISQFDHFENSKNNVPYTVQPKNQTINAYRI